MPIRETGRDQSKGLTGKQRQRLEEIALDERGIDELAQETIELAQALVANRLTEHKRVEIALAIKERQAEIRRTLTVAFFKMAAMGARIEPDWDIDKE